MRTVKDGAGKTNADMDFLVDLQQFMYARMERLFYRKLSRRYAELSQKADFLFERVKASLPEEIQDELAELVDVYSGMEGEVETISYQQGFFDCVKLIRLSLKGGVRLA